MALWSLNYYTKQCHRAILHLLMNSIVGRDFRCWSQPSPSSSPLLTSYKRSRQRERPNRIWKLHDSRTLMAMCNSQQLCSSSRRSTTSSSSSSLLNSSSDSWSVQTRWGRKLKEHRKYQKDIILGLKPTFHLAKVAYEAIFRPEETFSGFWRSRWTWSI